VSGARPGGGAAATGWPVAGGPPAESGAAASRRSPPRPSSLRSTLRSNAEDHAGNATPVDVAALDDTSIGVDNNNYSRPIGQNVGNFITDRSSSRVLAPPGGHSSVFLG
jgi:hypothetical protein